MDSRSVLAVVLCATLGGASGCRPPAPQQAQQQGAALSPEDARLLAAAKIALPPSGLVSMDLPEAGSPGAQLIETYCAQCHALPTPVAHSANDWPSVARRMWLRTEWLPADMGLKVPTLGERYAMLEYLTRNALKVSTTLPPGRGRETFEQMCSRCHALPDPRTHSAEDWPIVYARMERNMDRMNVSRPTGGQPAEILEYLRAASATR